MHWNVRAAIPLNKNTVVKRGSNFHEILNAKMQSLVREQIYFVIGVPYQIDELLSGTSIARYRHPAFRLAIPTGIQYPVNP